jgi:subtilisin family serine protease
MRAAKRSGAAALAAILALASRAGAGDTGFVTDAPALAALGGLSPVAARKLAPGVWLPLLARPALGARGILPAAAEAPVVVALAGGGAPSEAELAVLRDAGLRTPEAGGEVVAPGRVVVGLADAAALARLARLPLVARVELDGAPLGLPPPLATTAAEVQALDAHQAHDAAGLTLRGAGVVACDVDTGIDVFHPLLFRADGGYRAWQDRDGDGVFVPGIDAVDLGKGPVVLRLHDARVFDVGGGGPHFGSGDGRFVAGHDWLYADLDGDGVRDQGRAAGFDDASPSFGEPLFAADDVDGDGVLAPWEKLVGLGSSKVRVVRAGNTFYVRGQNLIDTPRAGNVLHGTASATVLAGGTPGLAAHTGIAPDAELLFAVRGEATAALYTWAFWCVQEGARVVLHEYAPWQGFPLDGSSLLEQFIDETSARGVAHVAPAGNLATKRKHYLHAHPGAATTTVEIEAPARHPGGPFHLLGVTLLWRDASRQPVVVLESPTGTTRELPLDGVLVTGFEGGLRLSASRSVTTRSTVQLDALVFTDDLSADLPAGRWRLRWTEASAGAPVEVFGYVQDDLSGWDEGVYFVEHASQEHLVGHPATADAAIAVAAYTGHGHYGGEPGARASYSGRGARIDGAQALSVAAPDDPVAGGFRAGEEASYVIFGGTSAASPHVAGAAALLLQARPDWDGGEVRAAIRSGALADARVGSVPSHDWGWGKLRVWASLFGKDAPLPGPAPRIEVPPVVAVAGHDRIVEVRAVDVDASGAELGPVARLELDRDYDGDYDEPIVGGFVVRRSRPGLYVAKVRATSHGGSEATALARVEVVRDLEPAGGLGCAIGAGRGTWGGAILLLAVGAAAGLGLRRGGRSRRGRAVATTSARRGARPAT